MPGGGEMKSISDVLKAALPAQASGESVALGAQSRIDAWWQARWLSSRHMCKHTDLVFFDSGRLVVFCSTPGYRMLLHHRAPSLLGEMRAVGLPVASLVVKVGPNLVDKLFGASR